LNKPKPTIVAGIDLSLRGCGLVAVPAEWGGAWASIARATIGRDLDKGAPFWEQIRRLDDLAEDVVRWIESRGCTHAYVEHYPVGSSGGPFNVDKLAELGGAIKVQLARELELFACPIPIASARSTACGSIPRLGKGKTKPYVHEVLRSIGAPKDWTADELDAWVIANHGLSLMGGFAIIAPRAQKSAGRGTPAHYRQPTRPTRDVEELIR